MATGPPLTMEVVLKVSTTEPDEPTLTSMMTLLSLSRMRAQVAVPVAFALLSLVIAENVSTPDAAAEAHGSLNVNSASSVCEPTAVLASVGIVPL